VGKCLNILVPREVLVVSVFVAAAMGLVATAETVGWSSSLYPRHLNRD